MEIDLFISHRALCFIGPRKAFGWFAPAATSWAAVAGRCRRTQGRPRAQQVRAGAMLVRHLVSFPITRRS